jgi:hypothetical protein
MAKKYTLVEVEDESSDAGLGCLSMIALFIVALLFFSPSITVLYLTGTPLKGESYLWYSLSSALSWFGSSAYWAALVIFFYAVKDDYRGISEVTPETKGLLVVALVALVSFPILITMIAIF